MVEVEAYISDFSDTSQGPLIRLTKSGNGISAYCYFSDPAESAKAAELIKGDRVIITGRYVGGTYGIEYQECSIRRADGKAIELTKLPPIENGICVLTVEEYLALDLARNGIRGEVLLQGGKAQITAKVAEKKIVYHRIISDWLYFYIGTDRQKIRCCLSYDDYLSASEGDMVTVVGKPSSVMNDELSDCKITKVSLP